MNREFYSKLVDKIYTDDYDMQLEYLTVFAEHVRHMKVSTLLNYRTFFVPDDFYLYDISDGMAMLSKYGLYYNERCAFNRRMVTPLLDFSGKVAGFVGYDDGSDLNTEEEKMFHSKYVYLDKSVFPKKRYMFITPDEYRKSIAEGYIMIIDGVYDKEALSDLNYNATSILSSSFTEYHQYYLKYIKNWIVVSDNDRAGSDLFRICKSKNPNTVQLKFIDCKDIDEKLKNPINIIKLGQTFKQMKSEGFRLDAHIDFDDMNNRRKQRLVI